MKCKCEARLLPSWYIAARPVAADACFGLSMMVAALHLRDEKLLTTLLLEACVLIFALLRISLLFQKKVTKLWRSIEWLSKLIQFSILTALVKLVKAPEAYCTIIFAIPLVVKVEEDIGTSGLRVLMLLVSLCQKFMFPETYASMLLAILPSLFDFSFNFIALVKKPPKRQSTFEESPSSRLCFPIPRESKSPVNSENKYRVYTSDNSGSVAHMTQNSFSHRLRELELKLHQIDEVPQDELAHKKPSLSSEKLEPADKDYSPKRVLRSQMSLVDPDTTLRERIKRLHRQRSFEKLKQTTSNHLGSTNL